MIIPWKYTVPIDRTPTQVLDRLEEITDSKEYSLWEKFLRPSPYLLKSKKRIKFVGKIDRAGSSFQLYSYLWNSSRTLMNTFTGTVEPAGSGSQIRLWVTPTKLGGLTSAILIALGFGSMYWDLFHTGPWQTGARPFAVLLTIVVALVDILHTTPLAKRLFLESIDNKY